MSNFTVVSAELAGKIRDYLHGRADYDERALLREVLLGGIGVAVVTDGVPANVPAASIYDADAGHLRNALGNTKWSEVPLDKLRAVADVLSPQEREPGGQSMQAPDGWVLVPMEPTEAMLAEGHRNIDWGRDRQNTSVNEHPSQTDFGGTSCKTDLSDAYTAMLSAAPSPTAALQAGEELSNRNHNETEL